MFRKYNSIENSYRNEFLERIQGHDFWNRTYVVQEKAHGSNLSFWTEDGINFMTAKRTGLLDKEERFYNHQLLLEKHTDQFKKIWQHLKKDDPNLTEIGIFGEVIGGNYPHKEVAKVKGSIKVQKGIYYCPSNEFYAFDIQINREKYLDVDEVNSIFTEQKMLHAQTIFEGSLDDCLQYPNQFESTIFKQLGLPEITPNVCEGSIIRPKENCYFNNGVRVMLKNKNDIWAEKIRREKPVKIEVPLSEKVIELQEELASYITENRLNNVLSKIGEVTEKDFGKVIGLFNKDAVEEFEKDNELAFNNLEKKEQKIIRKSIYKISAMLVRAYFRR